MLPPRERRGRRDGGPVHVSRHGSRGAVDGRGRSGAHRTGWGIGALRGRTPRDPRTDRAADALPSGPRAASARSGSGGLSRVRRGAPLRIHPRPARARERDPGRPVPALRRRGRVRSPAPAALPAHDARPHRWKCGGTRGGRRDRPARPARGVSRAVRSACAGKDARRGVRATDAEGRLPGGRCGDPGIDCGGRRLPVRPFPALDGPRRDRPVRRVQGPARAQPVAVPLLSGNARGEHPRLLARDARAVPGP